jgi:MFS family permease
MSADTDPNPPPSSATSALAPLKHPVFRMLWGTWLTANLCMWMNDVAAAWLMTSLATAPLMVALVQSASTLPVFLLGMPSGALADIIDRRRYFITTQFWVAAVAVVLCTTAFTGTLSAPLLLALTFANGIGLAMRWPVFAALIPEMVPRQELPNALALNGIAMNGSRILGPLIAGAVIATAGSAYVFLLNAALSITVALVLMSWRRKQKASALPGERFVGAMRVGLQYVRQSPVMHAILLRIAVFFLCAQALLALLPLIAKRLPAGDAQTFTLLMAALGAGAIIAALFLPRLRHYMTRDELVRNGTLIHSGATLVAAFAPNVYVATPALLLAGMGWISVANSLVVAAQMTLPDWVKARGMSIYQMTMMGATALSAALWGQVATVADVRTSLTIAAIAGAIGLLATRRFKVGGRAEEDLTPARLWKEPEVAIPFEPDQGPVLVTVEYRIDLERAADFLDVMRESRRSRLRNGAIAWELFRDTADPARYIEYFVDESWIEYLRRHDRETGADDILREHRKQFHIGDAPPVVSIYIAEPIFHA